MDLSGKTALITGAAKRVGRVMALNLADAGCNVVVHFNNSYSEAQELVDAIQKRNRQAWARRFDLEDSNHAADWFSSLAKETGGIDILVNSASIFPEDRYESLSDAALSNSMRIHLLSPLAFIHEMAAGMAANGRTGAVVNLLDTRIADRDELHASYHLAKRSLYTVTRDLALSMAPRIRINAIAPGLILPPPGKDDSWLERLKTSNPLQSVGSAEELADTLLFLLRSDFITGQVIYVDGGRHLKGNTYGL